MLLPFIVLHLLAVAAQRLHVLYRGMVASVLMLEGMLFDEGLSDVAACADVPVPHVQQ